MAGNTANVTLIGNAGKDAELSYTPSGKAVTKFSLAVKVYTGKDSTGPTYETDWYDVTTWGQQAEAANKLASKGTLLCVTGTLHARKYTTKEGRAGMALEVTATQNIIPLSQAPTAAKGSQATDRDPLGDLDNHPF